MLKYFTTLTALLVPLSGTLYSATVAADSMTGYGSFRPLDSSELQGAPGMKRKQTFSGQGYTPALPQPLPEHSFSPSQSTPGGSLYGRAPTSTPGYEFRPLSSEDAADSGMAKFRPDKQSGNSPYAWGGGDGNWPKGSLAPAPLFRPQERQAVKTTPAAPALPWYPAPLGTTGAYPATPYPNYYPRPSYRAPYSRRGGFPMPMPW